MTISRRAVAGTVIVAVAVVLGCASNRPVSGGRTTADAAYHKTADEYLAGYLAWRPGAGTGLGLHEYDGRTTDFSRRSIDAEYARLTQYRDALEAAVTRRGLSPEL